MTLIYRQRLEDVDEGGSPYSATGAPSSAGDRPKTSPQHYRYAPPPPPPPMDTHTGDTKEAVTDMPPSRAPHDAAYRSRTTNDPRSYAVGVGEYAAGSEADPRARETTSHHWHARRTGSPLSLDSRYYITGTGRDRSDTETVGRQADGASGHSLRRVWTSPQVYHAERDSSASTAGHARPGDHRVGLSQYSARQAGVHPDSMPPYARSSPQASSTPVSGEDTSYHNHNHHQHQHQQHDRSISPAPPALPRAHHDLPPHIDSGLSSYRFGGTPGSNSRPSHRISAEGGSNIEMDVDAESPSGFHSSELERGSRIRPW